MAEWVERYRAGMGRGYSAVEERVVFRSGAVQSK
jgi:hypothetical protein